jgi:hypothetical protein
MKRPDEMPRKRRPRGKAPASGMPRAPSELLSWGTTQWFATETVI